MQVMFGNLLHCLYSELSKILECKIGKIEHKVYVVPVTCGKAF